MKERGREAALLATKIKGRKKRISRRREAGQFTFQTDVEGSIGAGIMVLSSGGYLFRSHIASVKTRRKGIFLVSNWLANELYWQTSACSGQNW